MPSIITQLTPEGAVVEALVGVSQHRSAVMRGLQVPVPEPVRLRFLVDTGATSTNISQGRLAGLNLPSIGVVDLYTASSGSTPVQCDEYDVSLVFPDSVPAPWGIASINVIECLPLDGPIDGLLGRAVLSCAILTYNPFANVVTISF